jgi:hypothetical protein
MFSRPSVFSCPLKRVFCKSKPYRDQSADPGWGDSAAKATLLDQIDLVAKAAPVMPTRYRNSLRPQAGNFLSFILFPIVA